MCQSDIVPRGRRCDVAVAVPRVNIGCEKSQCSLYICYFVSIWSQFF